MTFAVPRSYVPVAVDSYGRHPEPAIIAMRGVTHPYLTFDHPTALTRLLGIVLCRDLKEQRRPRRERVIQFGIPILRHAINDLEGKRVARPRPMIGIPRVVGVGNARTELNTTVSVINNRVVI